MPTIRFTFDYLSTNAYIAWTQLPGLAAKYGHDVEPIPVLFAGLLEAHGTVGPAEVPMKALWMAKNNVRKAGLLGVPLAPPAFHPFNPLLALRASSLPLPPADRDHLIDGLFRAVWVGGRHVSDAAVVAAVATDAGLDGARIVADAQAPDAKVRLRRQTDDAIARGVFGVPSMEVGDELFWGYDDFPYLEAHLAGRDLLAAGGWAEWAEGTRPSAVRRRFQNATQGILGRGSESKT
jgi:2-hydroxychromene-2-carboxylate isomerase